MADDDDDRFAWMERSLVKAIHRERKKHIGKPSTDDKVEICKFLLRGWIGECKRYACIDLKHASHPESCSCMEDVVLEGNQLEDALITSSD